MKGELLDDDARLIAVIMPNDMIVEWDKWPQYRVSVNQVEDETGFRFFSAMNDKIKDKKKAKDTVTIPKLPRAHGYPGNQLMKDKVQSALATASGDLLFPSETDAKLEPFVSGKTKNSISAGRAAAKLTPDISCQNLSPINFLGDLFGEEDYRTLRRSIASILSDLTVYKFGEIEITYFIVTTDARGRLPGLKTTAVET